jgi:transmembrane sensor
MFKRRWGSAAIGLAAVLGAMGWWLTSERIEAEADRVMTTGVGQQREMRLADGSQIVLNTQTTLATREFPERVEIDLRSGEALFNTTAKLKKPLRVAAGPATVEISQGRLSIRRMSEWELVVRVFSGVVRVSPAASLMHVKLEAGRAATFGRDKVVVESFSPAKAVRLQSWTKGRLLFDGDSLAEVTSEFNRYNREKILIADDSLAQFRIGGGYNATNPVGFARALEATFNIRAVSVRSGGRGASVIVLTRRASEKSKTQRSDHQRKWATHETV